MYDDLLFSFRWFDNLWIQRGTLKVWDITQLKNTIKLNDYYLICCAVLPDKRIVCCSLGYLEVWNIRDGDNILSNREAIIRVYPRANIENWINCCSVLSNGRIVIGCNDATLRVLEIQQNKFDEIIVCKGHTACVRCCKELSAGQMMGH